jgi:hypothetical protein
VAKRLGWWAGLRDRMRATDANDQHEESST